MGGMGSGYYGSGVGVSKAAVEQCRSIDIRRWQRDKLLNAKPFVWEWRDGEGNITGSISVIPKEESISIEYKANDEPISLDISYDETKTNYGVRKWFLCPACGDRRAVLYLKGRYFACRGCHDLNYMSSQTSGDAAYYHHQLQKTCKRLGGRYDPTGSCPPRPRGMHYTTYWHLCIKYMHLAEKRDQAFITGGLAILKRIGR